MHALSNGSGEPPGPTGPPGPLVVLVASSGGPAAVAEILSGLPPDFPAPILALLHLLQSRRSRPQGHQDLLPAVLGYHLLLPVANAREGVLPRNGHVYTAPPDCHLEIDAGRRLRLSAAPPEHFCRPSADVLFHSLAQEGAGDVIAVICTGRGVDGAAGLLALREAGAVTIAQEPGTCKQPQMPEAAIRLDAAEHVVPLDEIPGLLLELVAASG